jgi:hypothetical protein
MFTSTISPVIETGDVLEFEANGESVTALVLLAGDALILDLLDGSMPIVARMEELGEFRRFQPETADYLSIAA